MEFTHKSNHQEGQLYPWISKENLKHCPLKCRMTAYISLIRSTLEYSSVIWDPYLQKDIDKLEKVQRQAARFISGDYTSMGHGCVTQMLSDLRPHRSKIEGEQTVWYSSSRWSRVWCRHCRPMTIWHQSMVNAKLNLGNSNMFLKGYHLEAKTAPKNWN